VNRGPKLFKQGREIFKEGSTMKYLGLLMIVFVASFFTLTFPQSADASADQENGVTLLQWLVGAFVLGWYSWKHFKGSIKTLSKNLFSKRKEEKKGDD
jgi:hypothetical protein